MRFLDVLDVREREGKQPAFASVGTIYINDNGKMSLYLPIFGRFFPIKEQQQRGGGGQTQHAPPPQQAQRSMPGDGYGPHNPPGDPMPPQGGGIPPQAPDDDDVPF